MAAIEAAGTWETVTPKKAEQWLNTVNTNNRKLRPGVVEKYAEDMKSGNWLRNPQPIMFYEDESLADGQHRLWAVVESQISVRFYIVRNVDPETALNIDTGLGRGLSDNARISGKDAISHKLIAMAKIVEHGTHNVGRSFSNAERLEMIEAHLDHLRWAEEHMPSRVRVGNAVVGAAIARAHMHERDLDRLGEFCTVLGSGMPQGAEDSACIALRNYLFQPAHGKVTNQNSHDVFLKAMNAIRYFMRRRGLTVIKGVKDEAYPLPERPKAAKKTVRILRKAA